MELPHHQAIQDAGHQGGGGQPAWHPSVLVGVELEVLMMKQKVMSTATVAVMCLFMCFVWGSTVLHPLEAVLSPWKLRL